MENYVMLKNEKTEDSVSTEAYYTNHNSDSTHKLPPPLILPPTWSKTRKRSHPSYQHLLQSIRSFETLQTVVGLDRDRALKILREVIYKNNQEILVAIKNFGILTAIGFNRDRALEILRENFCKSREEKEEMQDCFSQTYSSSVSEETEDDTILMKKAANIKFKKLSKLLVEEDDLKRNISNSFVCKECGEVFEDYRALGGHMASHNRKKRAKLDGNGGFAEADCGGEKNYKCNLCSRSFETGQALGGHKSYHRKTTQLQASSGGPQFQFDLNCFPHELD